MGGYRPRADDVCRDTSVRADDAWRDSSWKADDRCMDTSGRADEACVDPSTRADDMCVDTSVSADDVWTDPSLTADDMCVDTSVSADDMWTDPSRRADDVCIDTGRRADDMCADTSVNADDGWTDPSLRADDVCMDPGFRADERTQRAQRRAEARDYVHEIQVARTLINKAMQIPKKEVTRDVGEPNTGSKTGDLPERTYWQLYRQIIDLQARIQRKAVYKGNQLAKGSLAAVAQITNGMIPLVWALHERRPIRGLSRLAEAREKTVNMGNCIVYVRCNLVTNDTYIGETENWNRRVREHFTQTMRHSKKCPNVCRGCKEHQKYRSHQKILPHKWIMLPLMSTKGKTEAKRIERRLIKRYKPSLNRGDKPFWLLKDYKGAYLQSIKASNKRTRTPPWKQQDRDSPETLESEDEEQPLFTKYESPALMTSDLMNILRLTGGKPVTVKVWGGKMDITKWPNVYRHYGNSYISDGIDAPTILAKWKPRRCTNYEFYIRPKYRHTDVEMDEVMEKINKFEEQTESSTEEELAFLWRVRQNLDKQERYRVRTMIWEECERRYEGFSRKPLEIKLPYYKELVGWKIKRILNEIVETQEWPQYLKDWYKKKTKVVTEAPRSIGDTLCNVTHPWRDHRGCACKQVRERRKRQGETDSLPEINGHIFCIGREYKGPYEQVLRIAATNIPRQTYGDMCYAWYRCYDRLPQGLNVTQQSWKESLQRCIQKKVVAPSKMAFPVASEVRGLRDILKGLVIGQLDKNNGELWMCCPALYDQALNKAYNKDLGYQPMKIPAIPKHISEAHQTDAKIIGGETIDGGDERDLVRLWKSIYRKNGWDEYAAYDGSGGFNKPYILFKAKNVTDPETRKTKWDKARPISPGTRHPMRRLLHFAGRAWSFITSKLQGEHFIINHGGQVPKFLGKAQEELSKYGDIRARVWDIDSCYPNMPRDIIRFSLRDILAEIKKQGQYIGVRIPRHTKTKPCTWIQMPPLRTTRKGTHNAEYEDVLRSKYVDMHFDVLFDIMEFALDHAVIRMPDNTLLRQSQGIPMGDPLSPAMTIGACAWMEKEWMNTIQPNEKRLFHVRRYMDDILMLYAVNKDWNHEKFVEDMQKSTCYVPPLQLTEGTQDTFLETRFSINRSHIRHWLKNENEQGQTKVWRYQHFASHTPYQQKRALLTSTLQKVHQMASDRDALKTSALAKIGEFRRLYYPRPMIKAACTYMAASRGERGWLDVRDTI